MKILCKFRQTILVLVVMMIIAVGFTHSVFSDGNTNNDVISRQISQTKAAEVMEYWTGEKMTNARPMPMPVLEGRTNQNN